MDRPKTFLSLGLDANRRKRFANEMTYMGSREADCCNKSQLGQDLVDTQYLELKGSVNPSMTYTLFTMDDSWYTKQPGIGVILWLTHVIVVAESNNIFYNLGFSYHVYRKAFLNEKHSR